MSTPSRSPDLDQLRKQAKELFRAFRAGDPRAHSRIAAYLPPLRGAHSPAFADGVTVRLAHALFVIARENGFPSWPRLKASTVAAADQQRTFAYPAETSASLMPTLRVSSHLARTQALLELSREVTELAIQQTYGYFIHRPLSTYLNSIVEEGCVLHKHTSP